MISVGLSYAVARRDVQRGDVVLTRDIIRLDAVMVGWAHWARYAHEMV